MRKNIVLLMLLVSVGCARLEQVLKPEPEKTAAAEPKATVTPPAPAAVADTVSRFECSDGTIAPSFAECQLNMARKRLPPSQQVGMTPIKPAGRTNDPPTGSVR